MRVLLFFDQTQAGAGGKERPNVELAIEKGGIGSYHMFEKNLKQVGATVIATMYCGNGYFFDNEEEVKRKLAGMVTKLKADVVICGPCFDYHDYAKMAAISAQYIEDNTDAKAVAMFSKESDDVVQEFKESVKCIKMPKKGGTGLNDSLENLAKVVDSVAKNESIDKIQSYLY